MNAGMDNTNVEVLLSLRDELTGGINNAIGELERLKGTTTSIGTTSEAQAPKVKGFSDQLMAQKSAYRELQMGAMFLGSSLMSMGVAMRASNNESLRGASNLMMMVGGISMAVGTASHFISAITKITSALQKMNVAQLIANVLQGPFGWAKILGGAAVLGLAGYATTRAITSATSKGTASGGNTVNQYIAGDIVTQDKITDQMHRGLLMKSSRNYSTGIK